MLFDRYRVIDIDTHITEPAGVWTDRVSKKWGDRVPHIKNVGGVDLWFIGDQTVGMPGAYSAAGHTGTFPDMRKSYQDIPAAMYDAKARLAWLDEEKLWANVIYPNVGGFGAGGFLRLGDRALMLECVQAYNDFLLEWCSADPRRLVPVMATPFWDVAESVREIQRCAGKGYKAVIFCNDPKDHGQPVLRDKHWDPIWATAQEAGLSISFHIGGGSLAEQFNDPANIGQKANFARVSTMATLDNARCISDLILSGIPHRFPRLPLVSVESGVGWVPYLLESLDWQWQNNGVRGEHPEYDLLPSDYFRRQIYTSFWFEEAGLEKAIELYPDNIMFETDYPHPTCQAPGPASAGTHPRIYAEKALAGVPESSLAKVLQTTAQKLYGLH
ncbi:MAG: amidohydrolase [Deltaproteobacteria bacterium]|nr:amidohydrolase [Deltaproteobacteria bacterium]